MGNVNLLNLNQAAKAVLSKKDLSNILGGDDINATCKGTGCGSSPNVSVDNALKNLRENNPIKYQ